MSHSLRAQVHCSEEGPALGTHNCGHIVFREETETYLCLLSGVLLFIEDPSKWNNTVPGIVPTCRPLPLCVCVCVWGVVHISQISDFYITIHSNSKITNMKLLGVIAT